jgi:hypothetical protein
MRRGGGSVDPRHPDEMLKNAMPGPRQGLCSGEMNFVRRQRRGIEVS